MRRLLLAAVAFAVACAPPIADNPSPTKASDPVKAADPGKAPPTRADPTACPVPVDPEVRERFAVGVVPDARVDAALGEAPKCHDEFIANPSVVVDKGEPRVVAEGTFEGHCPGEDIKRKYAAVKPDKLLVRTTSTRVELGELGVGKPITLLKDHADWIVTVQVAPADRCGALLSVGTSHNLATWSLGAGCDAAVKLVPFTSDGKPVGDEMQLAPVGAGTCTIQVEMLGLKAAVPVTVK